MNDQSPTSTKASTFNVNNNEIQNSNGLYIGSQ